MVGENELKKYDLSRRIDERLKIFFLIIKPIGIPKLSNERAMGVVAYRVEDTMMLAREIYPPGSGFMGYANIGDFEYLDNILGRVEMPGRKMDIRVELPKQEPKKMTKQDFILGLQLATDDYIKDKKVGEVIKKALKEIKI